MSADRRGCGSSPVIPHTRTRGEVVGKLPATAIPLCCKGLRVGGLSDSCRFHENRNRSAVFSDASRAQHRRMATQPPNRPPHMARTSRAVCPRRDVLRIPRRTSPSTTSSPAARPRARGVLPQLQRTKGRVAPEAEAGEPSRDSRGAPMTVAKHTCARRENPEHTTRQDAACSGSGCTGWRLCPASIPTLRPRQEARSPATPVPFLRTAHRLTPVPGSFIARRPFRDFQPACWAVGFRLRRPLK